MLAVEFGATDSFSSMAEEVPMQHSQQADTTDARTAERRFRLSNDELAFVFLLQSHKLFCKAVSELLTQRMRVCYPVTWLDEICACFSASQAKHVRRRLEDGEELQDVFVVCKIFKNFLRRAFVDYGEGDPERRLDPMEKELFAFQLQDVESSRHMAFHGEGVSVEETILSLSSMKQLLTTLSNLSVSRSHTQTSAGDAFQLDFMVSVLLHVRSMPGFSAPRSVWLLREHIYKLLVYRCMAALETDMKAVLGVVAPTERSTNSQPPMRQLSDFLHQMKKEIAKPASENQIKRYFHPQANASKILIQIGKVFFGNVSLRNKLAHGAELRKTDVQDALDCTATFLKSIRHKVTPEDLSNFTMDLERTMDDSQHCSPNLPLQPNDAVLCMIEKEETNQILKDRSLCLRPNEAVFVGREVEVSSCVETFQKASPLKTTQDGIAEKAATRCIVITGPPGVGKSTPARQILSLLRCDLPRQRWVTADTHEHLRNELSNNLLPHNIKKPSDSPLETTLGSLSHKGLVVFDNLRNHTASLVLKLFCGTKHLLIVTTYTLKAVRQLKEGFSSLHVPLQSFTTEESIGLVKCLVHLKGDFSCDSGNVFWEEVSSIVKDDLENLPLAVKSFALLLRRLCRSIKEQTNKQLNVETLLHVRRRMLADWESFERDSENSFHVRGLSGSVAMALEEIRNDPRAQVMAFAGALSSQTPVRGNCFDKTICALITVNVPFYNPCTAQGNFSKSMLFLLNTVDSLRGKANTNRVAACEKLEDLGLVWTSDRQDVVHMHPLVQMCICQNPNSPYSHLAYLLPNIRRDVAVDLLIALLLNTVVGTLVNRLWTHNWTPFLSIAATFHTLAGRYSGKCVSTSMECLIDLFTASLSESSDESITTWNRAIGSVEEKTSPDILHFTSGRVQLPRCASSWNCFGNVCALGQLR